MIGGYVRLAHQIVEFFFRHLHSREHLLKLHTRKIIYPTNDSCDHFYNRSTFSCIYLYHAWSIHNEYMISISHRDHVCLLDQQHSTTCSDLVPTSLDPVWMLQKYDAHSYYLSDPLSFDSDEPVFLSTPIARTARVELGGHWIWGTADRWWNLFYLIDAFTLRYSSFDGQAEYRTFHQRPSLAVE